MLHFSQHDPAYGQQKVGGTSQTIYSVGCFGCSIATLYQVNPSILFKIKSAFNANGELDSKALAKFCGGDATGRTTTPPKGWCIAVTDFYAPKFFPTHFFVVNMDTKQMIDPLDYPAQIKPLRPDYRIKEFRTFSNIKFNPAEPLPPTGFDDVKPEDWFADDVKKVTDKGIMTAQNGLFRPNDTVTRAQLAAVIARALGL